MDFVNAECIIADSTGWADTLTHITEVEGAQMHVDFRYGFQWPMCQFGFKNYL